MTINIETETSELSSGDSSRIMCICGITEIMKSRLANYELPKQGREAWRERKREMLRRDKTRLRNIANGSGKEKREKEARRG